VCCKTCHNSPKIPQNIHDCYTYISHHGVIKSRGKILSKAAVSPEQFFKFGELLKYLRRREQLTQRELAIQVQYSDTQISRIEQNQRVPDEATLTALFVPALHLEREPEWTARLLELARQARLKELPETEATEKPIPKNNLPSFLTTFIGREKEQVEILQRIASHRLVTLTGSGGVGKTRLALQVGEQVSSDYADGVWFVELAPLSDPTLLAQRVATVLGIVTQSTMIPYTELLTDLLRKKTVLLILDNCEHLVDTCAALADTLLKSCPRLKILATSREALGILGEIQYRLPSLELPDIQQTLEKIREYESVRLFQERAQLAQPDFKLTFENAASVAQICSRLDGIPLAIELAAARVTIFSPAQIAARLDKRFNLLTGGSRTALARQQTMRASIDWSWNLISEPERTLLRRLTVFAGGWTLEAAESVCSTAGVEPQQVSELMSQLVSKSLVVASRRPGRAPRFHLHETIKQYVHEKLLEAGEEQNISSRHLKYFLEFSKLAESAFRGPQQMEWFDRLADERGNFRVALEHACGSDLEAALYLAAGLLNHWYSFDVREGLSLTTKLIQTPEADNFPHARSKARLTQANILWNMQEFDASRFIAEECLATFRAYGDRDGEYDSLMALGRAMQFLRGMERRSEFHRQALALAQSLGDVWRQAYALSMLGWDQRDPGQGRAHWEQAIALWRQTGDRISLTSTLGILGFTLLSNGDLELAETLLEEAYTLNQQTTGKNGLEFVLTGKSQLCLLRGEYEQARAFLQEDCDMQKEVGNQMGYFWARARLAHVALREGSLTEAHQLLDDVIRNFQADRNKNGLAFALEKLASLYVILHKPEIAATMIGWSDATRQEIGDPRQRLQQDELDQDVTTIIETIGASAYQAAYDSGCVMALDEAVQYALDNYSE
jgi:predicted ATPase